MTSEGGCLWSASSADYRCRGPALPGPRYEPPEAGGSPGTPRIAPPVVATVPGSAGLPGVAPRRIEGRHIVVWLIAAHPVPAYRVGVANDVRLLLRPAGDAAQARGTVPTSPTGAFASSVESRSGWQGDLNRIGVVFVHGIGTQPACETFLDWSGSIVGILGSWREGHGFAADPVRRCEYDLTGTRLPVLELDVPEYEGHPAQTWVMTEAWWAATTRSPGLGSMTAYVRKALPGIMNGIRDSYRIRTDSWARQRAEARAYAKTADAYEQGRLVLGAVPGRRTDWIDILDRIQKELTILAFGPALALGSIALWVYAPFRAIPIKPIQDIAALRSADNFLTRWFGELPDIISDPVQSANVRSRLVAAVRGLNAEGCRRIVVVAHSGGAIVSFTTLCDPAFMDLKVDKLVTLGEGLALAWRIENAYKGLPPGSRLLGDLSKLRPDLRWADFWSTYDPAPAGPIDPPPGVSVADQSYPTINRMSLLEDHGAYWDNDEEFMIPLLQHIDATTGGPDGSRFFRDRSLVTVRLAWRRRRVAFLALWRWIATLGAGVPIAVTTATALLGAAGIAGFARLAGPGRLGAALAGGWSSVPGHEIIAGPLDGISKIAAWPGVLPIVGEWAVGCAVIATAFLVLARIGVEQWTVWDCRDRAAALRRVPGRVSSWPPAVTFCLLTAVAAAMSAATFAYLWR